MNNKVLYFHINPFNNEVFYVGIGSKKRPYSKCNRSKWWVRIVEKYGYTIDIIKSNLTWEEACNLERFYINKIGRKDLGLGTLINLTNGGDGTVGAVHSQEFKNKLCIANKGKILSDNTKKKMSMSAIGRKHSEESKQKMCIIRKGEKRTDEAKKNISISKKGKKCSHEHILKRANSCKKKVIQLDLDGNFIKEWDSTVDINKELNINKSSISSCCRGIYKKAGGYIWKFKQ